jgi:ribosomal protein S18 acetylase RimI-like enzyme
LSLPARRFGALSARPPTASDADFLEALYLAARPDLGALPVPRGVIEGIARHQRALQREAYARDYPRAREWIVEGEGRPLGLLVLDADAERLRVVDLSIAAHERRRGHARTLLLALQDEAGAAGLSLRLRVRRDNAPARALYASLGLVAVGGDAAVEELAWSSGQKE